MTSNFPLSRLLLQTAMAGVFLTGTNRVAAQSFTPASVNETSFPLPTYAIPIGSGPIIPRTVTVSAGLRIIIG